jgi:hypothetical protein
VKRAVAIALCVALCVALCAQEATYVHEYVVVSADNVYDLQKEVNGYVKRGYCLYGEMIVTWNGYNSDRRTEFYQVVVKR